MREDVTETLRKLHNEELRSFNNSLYIFFQWLFQPIQGPGLLFSSVIFFFTDSRTPWTSDQLVARPLPKHRTTRTQNKRIYTPNIYVLSGIRTHDPSVRASEDSSCLRTRGYCDRPSYIVRMLKLRYKVFIEKPEGKIRLGRTRR
jgi:hypothetical protein